MVFAWGSLSNFIRAVRWRLLIQAEKPVRLRDVFWANMAGYLGNNILPARAGELIRAAYLGAKAQISVTFILATGLAERLVDLVALIMIGSFALAASGLTSAPLQNALRVMALVGIVGLVAMLLLPRFGIWMEKIITVLPLIGEPLKKRLVGLLRQFLHGLRALLDIRRASGFGLLTLLIWFMDGLGTVFVGYVLIIHITLLQAFVLLAGLGLSSAIPSTPGYIGVYQFVAIMILVPFGLDRETAIAFVLVLQIIGLLVVAVWGGISLWKINRLDKSGGVER